MHFVIRHISTTGKYDILVKLLNLDTYVILFCMFQLAAQFGSLPGASNSSQQSSAGVSSTRGSGSQTTTPSKRASRKRARTPKKSSTQTSSSMYPGEDHPGSMSSTVSAGMPDENTTVDEMQDRME